MHRLISLVAASMLAAFAITQCGAAPQNIQGLVIPREFQNINFENYLKNPRAVAFQLKCVIYDGPCDSIGKYLKANFPNWLSTQCRNCNANQKKQAGKAISFFQQNYPKEWNDGVKKYRGTFNEDDIRRFETELGVKIETAIPAGGPPKPDSAGLAALAKEAIEAAKATPEPLIFESRTTAAPASSSAGTTQEPAVASTTVSAAAVQTTVAAAVQTTVAPSS